MKNLSESFDKCVEMVMLIRPDLSEIQSIIATMKLHDEVVRYLEPGKMIPSLQRAIYESDLPDKEFAVAYYALSAEEQRERYSAI